MLTARCKLIVKRCALSLMILLVQKSGAPASGQVGVWQYKQWAQWCNRGTKLMDTSFLRMRP